MDYFHFKNCDYNEIFDNNQESLHLKNINYFCGCNTLKDLNIFTLIDYAKNVLRELKNFNSQNIQVDSAVTYVNERINTLKVCFNIISKTHAEYVKNIRSKPLLLALKNELSDMKTVFAHNLLQKNDCDDITLDNFADYLNKNSENLKLQLIKNLNC